MAPCSYLRYLLILSISNTSDHANMATNNTEAPLPRDPADQIVMSDGAKSDPEERDHGSDGDLDKTAEIAENPSGNRKSGQKTTDSSTHSESSTVEYEQTPFTEFSVQVKELCHSIWPHGKEPRVQPPLDRSDSRIAGLLRSKKLHRFLTPSKSIPSVSAARGKEFEIERLAGGSFNRIVGVTVLDSELQEPDRLILRVPRSAWEARPDRDVAIMHYVRQHTKIPVPEVKYSDFTAHNPLKRPYVLQSRVPGRNLQTIYGGLNHGQNCTVAKEVAKICLALQATTNPLLGLIELASPARGDGPNTFTIRPFDIRSPHDMEWRKKPVDHEWWREGLHETLYQDTSKFLIAQFGRWRAYELLKNPADILYGEYQDRFAEAAEQMTRLGLFDDDQNCLCHFDLVARNVMVDIRADGSLAVSGVLDWDSVCFVPKFVSCAPPWWVWQDDPDDDGAGWDESDETRALKVPVTSTGKELKRLFEEAVGEPFLRYAYQPQYRLARKLFHFAVHGIHSSADIEDAKKFFEEWNTLYESEIERQYDEERSEKSEASGEYVDPPEDMHVEYLQAEGTVPEDTKIHGY